MKNAPVIRWQSDLRLDHARIVELLREFGDLLPDPLSERVELDAYAKKVMVKADIALAFLEGRLAGLAVLYANDFDTCEAHVPLVSVAPQRRSSPNA